MSRFVAFCFVPLNGIDSSMFFTICFKVSLERIQ